MNTQTHTAPVVVLMITKDDEVFNLLELHVLNFNAELFVLCTGDVVTIVFTPSHQSIKSFLKDGDASSIALWRGQRDRWR